MINRKSLLLASAALALGFGTASADSSKLGWYGSIEGGWTFTSGLSSVYALEEPGYFDPAHGAHDVSIGDGVNGALYLGYRLNNGWDFGLGISVLVTRQDSASASGDLYPAVEGSYYGYQFDEASGHADLTSVMLDFEAGYDVGLSSDFDLRFFGGLRAGFISSQTETTANHEDWPVDPYLPHQTGKRSSEFVGAGPRLGLDARLPLGENFSLFGGVSGAVLLGRLESESSSTGIYYGIPYPGPTTRRSEMRAVYQLEGELGLSYDLTDAGILGAIQLGYRGGQTWNAVDNRSVDNLLPPPNDGARFGDANDDLTTHGPFIRVVFQF